ncbi:hypothetical protein BB560_002329 [Smittium megazygosporum]|uniref:DUF155 domain-containing protein n=1 Tax=Smittium megazygosporum TaxID=133381 RepID=A0A2T9ZF12_9FUNG|nr:hypothetical protein BB560_002329 [Smittium megazygosporum]
MLSFSHAIAQSVKLDQFEEFVETTIFNTKKIPQSLALHGIVNMSRSALMKKIGMLYIVRVNINLVSNILDTPEMFWYEPELQSVYENASKYLEISSRVELLNHKVSVIGDMLKVLRDHVNGSKPLDIIVMSIETFLFYSQS